MFIYLRKYKENLDKWINNCPFSTDKVISHISEENISPDGISNALYLACGRFLREYILTEERAGKSDRLLNEIWYRFKNEAKEFISEDNYPHRLNNLITGGFDIDVINNYLGHIFPQAFSNYEDKVKEAEEN
ncbi:conserved domain protein [Haemophilus pittmaniae HK 85]|uniref:Conserved domain protein n=1 Tax=Haemophilus pittmaniae HK 85 TaxID=1035188 RepID=F9QA77_9PAST|nr:hypothetical protein [Haemophilus pittmaniae]EGV05456.1 conserved domain protein [Haemophilus pittmaniae HK 85]